MVNQPTHPIKPIEQPEKNKNKNRNHTHAIRIKYARYENVKHENTNS